MVTANLFGFILGFGQWLIDFLPASVPNFPDIGGLVSRLAAINYFLPLSELFSAVLAVIALTPAFITTTVLTWLGVGVIRGGSPRA